MAPKNAGVKAQYLFKRPFIFLSESATPNSRLPHVVKNSVIFYFAYKPLAIQFDSLNKFGDIIYFKSEKMSCGS